MKDLGGESGCMQRDANVAYFLPIPDFAWRNSGNSKYVPDRTFSGTQFWEVPDVEVALVLRGKSAGNKAAAAADRMTCL
jgi:hypothetical protein